MLCDQVWQDPDLNQANGILMRDETDMLRMDAIITTIQLNIRSLLEVGPQCCRCGSPAISAAAMWLPEPSCTAGRSCLRMAASVLSLGINV